MGDSCLILDRMDAHIDSDADVLSCLIFDNTSFDDMTTVAWLTNMAQHLFVEAIENKTNFKTIENDFNILIRARKKCIIARCPEQFFKFGVRTSPPTHRQPTEQRSFMPVVPGIDGSCSELAFHPAPSVVSIAQGGGGRSYPRVLRGQRTVSWSMLNWK